MRVVLDTNVFVSGIFFSGPPQQILSAWGRGAFDLLLSPEVLAEYQEVVARLAALRGGIDVAAAIELVTQDGVVVDAPPLATPVCRDADDDMFLACARTGGARYVVSGDDDLLSLSEFRGIHIIRPRTFLDEVL